ncbi:MAG: gamma carbonic anhydrase family protein [Bacteroidia bacterium]|nr:gamma carbonic anhydrase family protein [Bacteroidia bacterium]MDW8236165.1 gamma carbonic anhydrase family protein [Bacteroidia bacterium]
MPIIRPLLGKVPQIGQDTFIAENAVIIGDVVIGRECSIWYNVVIRGDVHFIRIGDRTNIQDGAILHCTYQKASLEVGNEVTVGHGAILHGCRIGDRVLVGMGAIVLDHAQVEEEVLIAAGALVPQGAKLNSGFLYAGVPARAIRPLSPEERKELAAYAQRYLFYKSWYGTPPLEETPSPDKSLS